MSFNALMEKLVPFAPTFVDAAIRGAIVLVVALLLTNMLRRKSAAARHMIWVGAVLVQLLLPILAFWGPRWEVAVSPTVASVMPVDIPVRRRAPTEKLAPSATSVPAAQVQNAPAAISGVPSSDVPERPLPSRTNILIALWATGFAFVLVRLGIGTLVVARLARRGNRVDDGNWLSLAQRLSIKLGIDRPLTLLRGNKLSVPVTWGIVYPVVLLPEDADNWPEERRTFVLVHEMAHVKRLDALTQLAGQLALAVFWFNPLIWVANRRMQLEREHACDDYVLRNGTVASTYAEELLAMVRSLGSSDRPAQPAFAALAMARRSEFEGRMLSILDPVLDRHPLSKGRALLSAAAALLLVVPLAALRPYERSLIAPSAHASELPATPTYIPEPPTAPRSFARVPLQKLERAAAKLGQVVTQAIGANRTACDRVPNTTGESVHLHSDDDDGGPHAIIDYLRYDASSCTSASFRGVIGYSPNEDDVISVAPGALISIRTRTSTEDHDLTLADGGGGAVNRIYHIGGKDAGYDEQARMWFAKVLPSVLMESGINTVPRVARWRREGGVGNVLAHTESVRSPSAKRDHYEALLALGKLTADEQSAIASSASRSLADNPTDLRAVLSHLGGNLRFSRGSVGDLQLAAASLTSSGEKSALLQAYGQTDDRDMLIGIIHVAQTLASSGDRSRLLQVIAPRYLTKNDRELEDSFYEAVSTLPSSGDMRNTLIATMPYGGKRENITRHIISSADSVASSGDRAAVLISLVNTGAVNTRALKDAFFKSVTGIPSEGDRGRVLRASAELLR